MANRARSKVIGATVPVLAVGVLAGIVALVLGAEPARRADPSPPPSTAQMTHALLAGIPQSGSSLGDPDAPVTLRFFADLQCPQSRQFAVGALPLLVRKWVRSGRLRLEFRSTWSDTPQKLAFQEQQVAALAAGRQGRLWNFVSLFYRLGGDEPSNYAAPSFLDELAVQSALDLARWTADRDDPALAKRLSADARLARAKALEVTPSFLLGPTGAPGKPLRTFALYSSGAFDQRIAQLLRRSG